MPKVTLDSVTKGAGVVLASDNLTVYIPGSNNSVKASYGRSSGKWYWEVTNGVSDSNYIDIGIVNSSLTMARTYDNANARYYDGNGNKYPENSEYGEACTLNDVIGVALDLDNGLLEFYRNGVWQGVSHTNITSLSYPTYPSFTCRGAYAYATFNFGDSPFKYKIPYGYNPYNGKVKAFIKSNGVYKKYNSKDYTNNIMPIMTGHTSGSITVSASSELSGNVLAFRAFNRTLLGPYNSWTSVTGNSNGGWLKIDFGNGVTKTVYKYALTTRGDLNAHAPVSWNIEGSNDNINYTILHQVNSAPAFSLRERREYSLTTTGAYRYYRFISTATTPTDRVAIGELELFEFTDTIGWKDITTSSPAESDFLTNGMTFSDLQSINSSILKQLNNTDNTIDVVYYTDELTKTTADVDISCNYHPVDEHPNAELLFYTPEDTTTKQINITATPFPRLVYPTINTSIITAIENLTLYTTQSGDTEVRIIASIDNGTTWKTFKTNTWQDITTTPISNVKNNGMTLSELNAITESQWASLTTNGNIRFAYYLEQKFVSDVLKINKLEVTSTVGLNSPALINANIVYNAFDSNYYGILFSDPQSNYYSTSLGQVLKYVDFGKIIAGQTTTEMKIVLENSLPFQVQNISITNNNADSDTTVEFSKTTSPFIAESSLNFNQIISMGEKLEFYVRLTIKKKTAPQAGLTFDIIAKADPL